MGFLSDTRRTPGFADFTDLIGEIGEYIPFRQTAYAGVPRLRRFKSVGEHRRKMADCTSGCYPVHLPSVGGTLQSVSTEKLCFVELSSAAENSLVLFFVLQQ